jgi:hypothetical protein
VTPPNTKPPAPNAKGQSWPKLFGGLLVLVAPAAIVLLIPRTWWSSYFEFRDAADGYIFIKHWFPAVVASFVFLAIGLLLEIRAYRLHKKFTYFTSFRLGLVIAVVLLFVFVQMRAT